MKLEVILEDNSKHPFMRGMLAHKLIQRGLSFDQAYQIAEDAKSFFHEQSEITSESLMKSVDELIVSRYGYSILKGLNRDLFKTGKQIIVFRRKAIAPFSKGLLTQSITAAGLKPEEAFRIAFDLETKLIKKNIFKISKNNLFEEVFKILKKKYNSHTANLYKLQVA
jgi:2-phosphoglycerate kinase